MKNTASSINVLLLIQGMAVSCLLLIVLALVMAVVTYFSPWQYTGSILIIGNYASILGGAVYIGTKLKQKLWLHGVLLGAIFLIIMTIIRADLKLIIQWFWVKQLVIVCILGILGSLCGGMLQS
ncbi:MAG TPA: TIGR04086 family membrane protein [Firmicutes bacterium]|nr:TIGR04086 family membrane protein [Bacillota bacterium]